MNDFTKEELIWLEEDIRYSLEEYRQPEIAYEIHKKLISMIENYCEHDWQIGFGSIHSPVIYCKKCFCQKPMVSNEIFNKLMETNK